MWKYREQVTLAVATLLTGVGFASIPSWQGALLDVCHHAAVAGLVTIALFFVTRRMGPRGIALERTWSALFLAGMPVVYIVAWLTAGGAGTGRAQLAVELAGLPIYATLAWLGLRRSPWLLVAGIAAHGIGWDAWHYAVESAYVPTWYVTGCLLADVGISLYLATRVPVWRSAEPAARAAAGREATCQGDRANS